MSGVLLAALVWMSPAVSAQTPAPQPRAVFVRAISVATQGPDAVVTIEANSPLPAPTVGTVDGPPRIFLDLGGVRTRAPAVTPSRDPRIRRVRVALHSVQPLVTRVVVDLAAPQLHRIEQTQNQLRIIIGSGTGVAAPAVTAIASTAPAVSTAPPPRAAAAPPTRATPAPSSPPSSRSIAPVPPLPDPPPPTANEVKPPNAPPASTPVTSFKPPPQPPSLREVEKYRAQVLGTIERYRLQLPVLDSIEDRSDRTTEIMELAGLEIDRLKQELAAVKPPETLRLTHDLLVQSARLAGMAIRLRAEAMQTGDSRIMRNATSAAAGAVLLLDRACTEVGCLHDR